MGSNSNGNMNNNGAPTMIRTNSQSQLSPVYLPPLATTPRFTVPTPRGAAQYHTINLNNMNNINMNTASPIQIQQNGSNPPSVSMLAASNINGNLQIPSSISPPSRILDLKKEVEKFASQFPTVG